MRGPAETLRRLLGAAVGAVVVRSTRDDAVRTWRMSVLTALAGKDRPQVNAGWRAKASFLRRGYLPHALFAYDLTRYGLSDYVSDHDRDMKMRRKLGAGGPAGLLDDKLAFTFMLDVLRVPTPRLVAVIVNGRVHQLAGAPGTEQAGLKRELEQTGKLVVKPAVGGGGHGVVVLESLDGHFLLNGSVVSWATIETFLRLREYALVTDHVEQAGYAAAIFPAATNTLRLLTIWDDEAGEPFLAGAVHRFGTARSAPVDNWTPNGLNAAIDRATGRLGPALEYPRGPSLVRHERHPDTGAPIAGVHVPGWEEVSAQVLELAGRTPFVEHVGWDIALTAGGPTVLEGNRWSGLRIFQVHAPILTDPRVRSFYERRGVIRPRGKRLLDGDGVGRRPAEGASHERGSAAQERPVEG